MLLKAKVTGRDCDTVFVGAASDKLQSCLQVILCILVHGSLLVYYHRDGVGRMWGGGGGGKGGRGVDGEGEGAVLLGCFCCSFFSLTHLDEQQACIFCFFN